MAGPVADSRARRLAGTLALALAMALAGCWDRTEINDLAIVKMVGVDLTEAGLVRLTLNIAVPRNLGGPGAGPGGGGGPRRANIPITGEGRTVMDAASRIQLQLSRRLFWGHAQASLIGERFARGGIRPALEFFLRERETRDRVYVLVTGGEASRVLRARPALELLPVEVPRELQRSRLGLTVELRDLERMLTTPGADPAVPRLELVPSAPGAQEGAEQTGDPGPREWRLAGAGLFRGERLVAWMDEAAVPGLLWLRREMRTGHVTAELPEGGLVTYSRRRARSQIGVRISGGQVTFDVRARSEGELEESLAPLVLTDPAVVRRVEAALERMTVEEIRSALSVIQEAQVDPAGFGLILKRRYPAFWRTVAGRWRSVVAEAKVQVHAEAFVRWPARALRSRTFPERALTP